MGNSSDDSVLLKLPTGQAEEIKLSDPDQDISMTDNDQASTEEHNYRETAWCAFIHGVGPHSRH